METLRTFHVQETVLDNEDLWSGILAVTMFATHAKIHTTLNNTPCQLVFGRDAMLNISHKADWKIICDRKQKLINRNNLRENAKRMNHTYNVGDNILIKTNK